MSMIYKHSRVDEKKLGKIVHETAERERKKERERARLSGREREIKLWFLERETE